MIDDTIVNKRERGILFWREVFKFNFKFRNYRSRFPVSATTDKVATMALRRPPTRIELKTEDIEEYEQVGEIVLPLFV